MNPIVERNQWQQAYAAQLAEEKAMTRTTDALAAKRRRMPWLKVDREYRFAGPEGSVSLSDLFDGRRQLIVYHHMLRPNDTAPCPGCSMVGDQIPEISHLHARDTSFVMVARAPIAEILAYRTRMGWSFPFVQTADGFGDDFDVPKGAHGLNVFIRGDAIYRTWFTTARGMETLGAVWGLLDLTPMGRQEKWQDAPDWVSQGEPYRWWRLHDEYAPPRVASSAA